MNEPWQRQDPPDTPEQVVGRAIQELTAARLGRGFLPLALLMMAGIAQLFRDGDLLGALLLALGGPVAGAVMLAYGMRVTQLAFGREERLWMSAAMLGSVVPPLFALYVLAWRGLRVFLTGSGFGGIAEALFFTLCGVWAMRSWMKVVEVERLSEVMARGSHEGPV